VTERAWRTSSYSGGQGNCVQVGQAGRAVAIRDSTDPGGPELIVGQAQWETFVCQVKADVPGMPGSESPSCPGLSGGWAWREVLGLRMRQGQ
jgi:hypothetical protein